MTKAEEKAYRDGEISGTRAAAKEALKKAVDYFCSGDGNMTTREVAYILRELSFKLGRDADIMEAVTGSRIKVKNDEH